MALDHRIQETLLDGARTEGLIMRALGSVGGAHDWSKAHLRHRLEHMARAGRVREVAPEVWVLTSLDGSTFMTVPEEVAI